MAPRNPPPSSGSEGGVGGAPGRESSTSSPSDSRSSSPAPSPSRSSAFARALSQAAQRGPVGVLSGKTSIEGAVEREKYARRLDGAVRAERSSMREAGHVAPAPSTSAPEQALRDIATKGVAAYLEAISAYQTKIEETRSRGQQRVDELQWQQEQMRNAERVKWAAVDPSRGALDDFV